MNAHRIITGFKMTIKMIFRRKIVILLIVVIPVVFLTVVQFTSSDMPIPFRLASVDNEIFVQIPERGISLVFFAIASAGFLISFIALNLIQKNVDVGKRLVICGFHPMELLISIFCALFLLILAIAVYIGLLSHLFYPVKHFVEFIAGLVLIGFVYGSYGLSVGSMIRGELEGILLILLLVNIDAGWLQNPIFYAQAQNQLIIRYLPAYYPSQISIVSAFSDFSITNAIVKSLVYGLIFLGFSMIVYFIKMRVKNVKKV